MIQAISATQILDLIQKGQTAAIREAAAKDPAVLKLRAEDGSTLIRQAVYRQNPEIARLLIELGAKPNFYDACALGDWPLANRFLTDDKANAAALARSFSEDGFSPLGLAVFFSHRDLAIRLLALGASAAEPSHNALKVTPLHSATAAADLVMVAILLSHGADPNAREFLGATPLHSAAAEGNLDAVKLLILHGASASLRTNAGETPLDLAHKYHRNDVAEWLAHPIP